MGRTRPLRSERPVPPCVASPRIPVAAIHGGLSSLFARRRLRFSSFATGAANEKAPGIYLGACIGHGSPKWAEVPSIPRHVGRLLAASHKSASRAVFTKKGNLAISQIPFWFCDGAEGGTRTPTGFPRPATPFSAPKIELFARGLQSVPASSSNRHEMHQRIPDRFKEGGSE